MNSENVKGRLDPEQALRNGVEILGIVLAPKGFTFQFRIAGKGSAGCFAWGEFIREDRRLELHFLYNLGLVRYHVGSSNAAHESYMRELGVWDQCQYPGFSDDPIDGFRGLLHDLQFAKDFLSRDAEVLERASENEAASAKIRDAKNYAHNTGEQRKLDELHNRFQEKRYAEVLRVAESLRYPELLTESEKKMIEIARKRRSGPMFGWLR